MFAVRRALSRPDVLKEVVQGLLASGDLAAGVVDADDPLGFVARTDGVKSVVEAAYRFCRHEPGVEVVLTGTGKREHLSQNVEAILAPPLPAALSQRLAAIFGAVDTVTGG